MISIDNLFDIVCTESYEYGGIQEIPDHKHGASQNFSAPKREARGPAPECTPNHDPAANCLRYDLELIREADGTLHWVE